jgi:hypothetical protein
MPKSLPGPISIILEYVRSFASRQSVPLRPLTLLVGENSTGKSTFLAVVASVFNSTRFPTNLSFNEPPYNLGTFETIATFKGGKYGRAKSFSVGFSEGEPGKRKFREAIATCGNERGEVVFRTLHARTNHGSCELELKQPSVSVHVATNGQHGTAGSVADYKLQLPESAFSGPGRFGYHALQFLALVSPVKAKLPDEETRAIFDLLQAAVPPIGKCFSFAPLRSHPKRTYDAFSEEQLPEGDHIPLVLAKLLALDGDSEDGVRVQDALKRFGKESGLFKSVTVRPLGKQPGDPFQVQVTVAGPPANLSDVGYGVSQTLPIVVQSVLRTSGEALLMQQPEVHLHPRAQAALGTFLAGLAAQDDRMFLIETHSDYLVDRVRQEVARGTLSHDKVQILFFHKPELETTVHPITLDAQGNVENAPLEYRRFFLQEELNLLSRAGE